MGWLGNKTATVVDLFAGTGGMGLASILTPELRHRARIVCAVEINPICVATIRQNYDYFSRHIGHSEQVPSKVIPEDVTRRQTLDHLRHLSRRNGGLTLLLAGPPCQGFSKSNSLSRERTNPQNLLALKVIDAIKAARPKIAIIENVPGIQTMPSARRSGLTVTEHLELELSKEGYLVKTALINAANYGIPQHRLRSFTVAVSTAITDEFDLEHLIPEGKYGEGRRHPHRTVRDAFGDLPKLENGAANVVSAYSGHARSALQRELRKYSPALFDHVTTRHSAAVLKRYAAIPPGGNWKSIRDRLRHYSHPDNTHANIYHRLHPDKPAGTISNFRKNMTVHPWENRGLSLREAARLQSLPDWLRFFNDSSEIFRGHLRGLGTHQQQVGNAVCFRLTSELVSHLFRGA